MSESGPSHAWLEREGERLPVTGNCSLGRAVSNQVVLVEDRVSRRHATIHFQGEQEFLLVDLGSRNGTYLNGRRVTQPMRLRDGDQLQVGPFTLVFRQPSALPLRIDTAAPPPPTLVETRSEPSWLLLCDVVGSSTLALQLSAEEHAMLVGGWFARCKEVIEDNGGVINKYLGDGLFAYWRPWEGTLAFVAQALRDLQLLQEQDKPRFRVALHHGQVTIGGNPSSGEESLLGPEVNLVFRLERLASELKLLRVASVSASERLGDRLPAHMAGHHVLRGLVDKQSIFTF